MKTSFTKWCREKVKNYLTLTLIGVLFASSNLMAEDFFQPCVSDVDTTDFLTVTLGCDAEIDVEFDLRSVDHSGKCYRFVFGTTDNNNNSEQFQIINHKAQVNIKHAPYKFDSLLAAPTLTFSVFEYCNSTCTGTDFNKYEFTLPAGVNLGMAANDWTGGTYRAIPSSLSPQQLVLNGVNSTVSGPAISWTTQSPTCPLDSNGLIIVNVGKTGEEKCDDFSVMLTLTGAGVSASTTPVMTGSGGSFTFTDIKSGSFGLAVVQTDRSCPCDFDGSNHNIFVQPASTQTVSLACLNEANVSITGNCRAVIRESAILLGADDPCGFQTMMDIADSIIIRDQHGTVVASGRDSVIFNDADQFSGQRLNVEIHDFHLDPVLTDLNGTGNYCWGTILIEDKTPPQLTCLTGTDTLYCWELFDRVNLRERGIDDVISQQVSVNECSLPITTTVIASTTVTDCPDIIRSPADVEILKEFRATYFATDAVGNESLSCTDTFKIKRVGYNAGSGGSFGDVLGLHGTILFPPDFTLPRGQGVSGSNIGPGADSLAFLCEEELALDINHNPAPIYQSKGGSMFPRLEVVGSNGMTDTIPLFPFNYQPYDPSNSLDPKLSAYVGHMLDFCKIGVEYTDLRLPNGTQCVEKIIRTWRIYEWSCEGELDTSWQQFIEIIDENGPIFKHPVANTVKTVNTDNCSRLAEIKMPKIGDDVFDDCSKYDVKIEVTIYDTDWNLIGPNLGSNIFEFPLDTSWVVYQAFDECHNSTYDTAMVVIVDETPPVVICKEFLVVGISGFSTETTLQDRGVVKVPASSFDNGSYDDCALKTTCVARMDEQEEFDRLDTDQDMWVRYDDFAPFVECGRDYSPHVIYDSTEVKINGVPQYQKFKVLHRSALCQPYIRFCCDDDTVEDSQDDGDFGNSEDVMVVFRAIDKGGRANECMVFVDIQDKSRPTIVCPPNIVMTCDFPFSRETDRFGSFFGNIVGEHMQENFGVVEEYPDFIKDDLGEDLVDGLWFDNCDSPMIFDTVIGQLDQCGLGTYERQFYAIDASGNRSNICSQFITFERVKKLTNETIVWPTTDTTIFDCLNPEDLPEDLLGKPTPLFGACTVFGTSYEDQIFYFSSEESGNGTCFKIVRTWSIIDWCTQSANTNASLNNWTQVVKVQDPERPIITACATPTEPFTAANCSGARVELSATATDNCTDAENLTWTATLKLNTNIYGSFDEEKITPVVSQTGSGSLAFFGEDLPLGTHKIVWTVSDACGNTSSCEQEFTVETGKLPTPFAQSLTTVLHSTDELVIWASDLDPEGKSFNSCDPDQELETTIVRKDGGFENSDANMTLTCADVPSVEVDFWVQIPGTERREKTTVTLNVQDNDGSCNTSINQGQSALIVGNVNTRFNDDLPNIEMNLMGGNQGASTINAVRTDDKGVYSFPPMEIGNDYVIDPTSSDNPLNGVTTLDIVYIQRYVLGLTDFENHFDIIAADVNNDRSVSALDLIELRSLILGHKDQFGNNEPWRFVETSYEFVDITNPLDENFAETYNISNLAGDMKIDFTGIKVGDVNGSVDVAGVISKSRSRVQADLQDRSIATGEIVRIPVSLTTAMDVLGFQFTASFDESLLQFAGIESDVIAINNDNIGRQRLADGQLSVSWNDVAAQNVDSDDVLVVLNFKATGNGLLSEAFNITSDIASAEIYNENLEAYDLSLAYSQSDIAESSDFALYQNSPNPFADRTEITFKLPKAGEATLTVYDVTGKVLKVVTGDYNAGINSITVDKNGLNASGIMFYTLDTEEFTDTKRMVVLK